MRSASALLAADGLGRATGKPRRFPFVQWDVFTKLRLAGNPLIVFPDARGLSDEEMQAITWEINQQETTFVFPRPQAIEERQGVRVRIFVPTTELPFAGHPTLGTAMALQALRKRHGVPWRERVVLELNAGRVPVTFQQQAGGPLYGEMKQIDPAFGSVHDAGTVAPILGLDRKDLDSSLPVQTVSTGLPFVLVPLQSREALGRIKIDWTRAAPYLSRIDPNALPYCFARDRQSKAGSIQARGIYPEGEDPATGSAAGCTVSLLVKQENLTSGQRVVIEQGNLIHRPSRMFASASMTGGKVHDVHVGGFAVQVASGEYIL